MVAVLLYSKGPMEHLDTTVWSGWPEIDRQRVSYLPRHRERLLEGRFKASHSKTTVSSGTESLKRCLLGQGTGPAQWPHTSRLVEAICLQLCDMYPRGQKISGFQLNRWGVVLRDYGRIRRLVLGSAGLMEATALQLFEINQRTLSVWYNNLQKKQERAVLSMDLPLPISETQTRLSAAYVQEAEAVESRLVQLRETVYLLVKNRKTKFFVVYNIHALGVSTSPLVAAAPCARLQSRLQVFPFYRLMRRRLSCGVLCVF
ncbi:hypothetical protein MHYP_G00192220 [Metynnis hypsauchen]